jgi:tetratricopeptide (TPR) repeat protein
MRRDTRIGQGFAHYRDSDSPGVDLKRIQYTDGSKQSRTTRMREGADVTQSGLDYIRAHRDESFFLWLHYFDAHSPYSAPTAFRNKIPESEYLAEVAGQDHQIGRIVESLRELGIADETLVAVTADHGEGLGEHGEPTHSYFVYESTMRVPLVFWGLSDLPRGKRIENPVRTIDIVPTVLDLLGLPALDGVEGVSLEPLISGSRPEMALTGYGEATRFLPTFGLPVLRFVREGQWKYIHKVEPELYDLDHDPGEAHNLAAEHPDVVSRLRSRLEEILLQTTPGPVDAALAIDDATAAQLVALGYSAESPADALTGAGESLALFGPDPNTRAVDTERLSIAYGYVEREEWQIAYQKMLPILRANPNSLYIHQVMMKILLASGRDDEAIAELGRRLTLELCDEEAIAKLAEIHAHRGEFDQQLEAMRRGAEACPEFVGNLNNYAWALATQNDPTLRNGELAKATIRKVLDRFGEDNAAHLDTWAAALAETGDFEAAAGAEARVI